MRFFQEEIKEIPARHAFGDSHPDVGAVCAAAGRKTAGFRGVQNHGRVSFVEIDRLLNLFLAFFCIDGFGAALDDVGAAVKLRALAAIPERIGGNFFPALRFQHQLFRDDAVAATHAGEARCLGIGAELDCDFFGAFDFVNTVRDIFVRDETFVGRVEKNDGAGLLGVAYPHGERRFIHDGAGGIVRRAEVNNHRIMDGKIRAELTFFIAGKILEMLEGAVYETAAAAGHDIAVDIDGIDGIGHGDEVFFCENFLDISDIALGAVGDEDFGRIDGNAAGGKIMSANGFAQKKIALLGAVAAESLGVSHFLDGAMHRLNHGGCKRLGHVADTERNQLRPRMRGAIRVCFFPHGREEIGTL